MTISGNVVLPITATCYLIEDGSPVMVHLNVMVGVTDNFVHVTVQGPRGESISETGMLAYSPATPPPAIESDANVLRRIAREIEGPDWSDCDE